MARIGENAFRQYVDGQDRLTAREYTAERELIRLAVNDLDDKVQRTEGIREEFSNTVNEVVQTKQEIETRIGEFSQSIDQTAQEIQQTKEDVSQVSLQLDDKASKTEVQEVSVQLEKKVYYFKSVENMKTNTQLQVGDFCITEGFYSSNDGGGAKYVVVPGGTHINGKGEASEGGTFHTLQNGKQAELLVQNKVTAKQMGLKFNDSSYGNFNAPLFLNLLKLLKRNVSIEIDEGTLYLTEVYANLTDYILLNTQSTVGGPNSKTIGSVSGLGSRRSYILVSNTDNSRGFLMNSATIEGFRLKNLTIRNLQLKKSTALKCDAGVPYSMFEDLVIEDFLIGLNTSSWVTEFKKIVCDNCFIGFLFRTGTSYKGSSLYAHACTYGYVFGLDYDTQNNNFTKSQFGISYSDFDSLACDWSVEAAYVIGAVKGTSLNGIATEGDSAKRVFYFPSYGAANYNLFSISINNYMQLFSAGVTVDFVGIFDFQDTQNIMDVEVNNAAIYTDTAIKYFNNLNNTPNINLKINGLKTNKKSGVETFDTSKSNGKTVKNLVIGTNPKAKNTYQGDFLFSHNGANFVSTVDGIISMKGSQKLRIPISKNDWRKYFLCTKIDFFPTQISTTLSEVRKGKLMPMGSLSVSVSGERLSQALNKEGFQEQRSGNLSNVSVDIIDNAGSCELEVTFLTPYNTSNESYLLKIDLTSTCDNDLGKWYVL